MITGKAIKLIINDNDTLSADVEYTLSDGIILPETYMYKYNDFTKERLLEDIKKRCESFMQCAYKKNLIDISDVSYQCDSAEMMVDDKPVTITDVKP